MFNNIGKKIKVLAKVIFWFTFITFVLGSIGGGIGIAHVMGCDRSWGDETGAVFAGIGIAIGGSIVGFFAAWIGSFFMYGYGQLIDDTEINRKTNQKILAQLGGEAVPEEPVAPVRPVVPVAPVIPQEPKAEGEWFCRKCGFKNDASAKFCMRCGTPNE
ncbi:MAG: zinc ribbon domain-containing protein [Clostridia bacterium]|nr:zinc ribbon domain-containing protein [Clostridia bacterium]